MKLLSYFRGETFARGIHPAAHKEMASRPIRRLPFAPRLVVPLSQHIGKPSKPLVRAGEEVVRGQPIAEADGWLSVPQHAPATGVVEAIELRPSARGPWMQSIVLRVHEGSGQEVLWRNPRDPDALAPAELVAAIRDTGMVGLGGAAFPSHAKLAVPKGATVQALVVNGCECEPYLTCDHRLMVERAADLIAGTRTAMRACGAPLAVIGVEDNKPDAAEAIRAVLPDDGSIAVEQVPTKYPQGSEKMLIIALFGVEVPSGALPISLGLVVNNVGTLVALGRLLPAGEGLIERVVTVAGAGVERPGNYLVPLGTPLAFVLECAGARGCVCELVLGGPMMGQAVASLDAPVTKGVSGVLVLRAEDLASGRRRVYPCIKCGECVESCPMGLNPSALGMLAARREYKRMASEFHLGDCFECGCCSYACPSGIPLVQSFRVAKQVLRERATA